ncbi:hypothetical protein ACTHQ6_09810 [Arthrobacter sp. SAFR-179]|uniref:hypothetical protein n=1 Tax=Arthrobacter sp. SAFR-179 TaxID=3387279 RepID=UPI003F7B4241
MSAPPRAKRASPLYYGSLKAKSTTPLADYGFADGFLASESDLQGCRPAKIVAVAVEVLTGLAVSMPDRENAPPPRPCHRHLHLSGGPQLRTAWRVALQVKTASARRIQLWGGTDGRIVFATVGLHHDMGI